ncbi:MAG: 4Fe-4S dicluster domain-containing protein [Planctomycetes bacterium]|nr:4Fe-4S dicluster domain-containing protein [Planctomycetota bacterium]
MKKLRKIIKIDEDLCNGCGECIVNCAEGALQIVDGKAKLVKDSFCDGLGACIGECPTGALTIEEREADDFDEEAVKKHMAGADEAKAAPSHGHSGCPGSMMRQLKPAAPAGGCPGSMLRKMQASSPAPTSNEETPSQLTHWPVQLTLVPPSAPFLQGADVLLVADCVPFAYADFHKRFLAGGRPVLVACPKLDEAEPYVEKLKVMLTQSGMKSLTIVHMEVPCCSGLGRIVARAKDESGSDIEIRDVTVSISGEILE